VGEEASACKRLGEEGAGGASTGRKKWAGSKARHRHLKRTCDVSLSLLPCLSDLVRIGSTFTMM
jgi:hypothetical protein